MRWRYVTNTLLGGLLGFSGQFITDFVCWDDMNGQGKTAYQVFCKDETYLNHELAKLQTPYLQLEARLLLYEAFLFEWLIYRGGVAGRTAAWTALFGASLILAADHIQENSGRSSNRRPRPLTHHHH